MKMKLFYSTALALAVIMASTGCKHKPVGVTAIPGQGTSNVGNPGLAPTYNGNTYGGGTGVGSQPIAASGYNPDNFTQDHDKLAANTIHFAYDSAVIRDSDQANLQAVGQELQANPGEQLLIEGNCDERGTEEYNRSLGERRALAAREALAKQGIDPSRVHEISYGKDKPADPGHDEAAWSKNRRDDFVVLHPKMGA
jgi:peptidoglycan-associated lipoprotein